jgi:hypothetical protein
MPNRVAIYARVSTTNGQDVSMQTRELRQFAETRGWQIVGEYIDTGVSGAKDSRPELNRLMADAHRRRFDVVCVWRFDRFARSVSHLLARGSGDFQGSGHRLRFVFRTDGHFHACGENGLYRSGSRRRTGAQLDRGAREGRLAQRPRQRQTHRTTNIGCGCLSRCRTTRFQRLLARDRTQARRQCENGKTCPRRAWQKPASEGAYKCRGLNTGKRRFAWGETIRFCLRRMAFQRLATLRGAVEHFAEQKYSSFR